MAESFLEVTPGSGLKLHTDLKTIGANAQHDQYVLLGEPFLATYRIRASGVSAATLDSHLLQIMAGASLVVYVRRIRVYQQVAATTVAHALFDIARLSTAGTGGSGLTPAVLDTTDGASGATAMTLPTAKGTEGVAVDSQQALFTQTITAASPAQPTLLYDFDFCSDIRQKGLRIPAGTANGIAVKNRTAVAAATCLVVAEIIEANF